MIRKLELIQKEEYKAEFQIIDQSTKKVIETLITDENGAAQSGKLDPGIYTVHQTKGSDNYKIADDFDVTIKDGDKKFKNLSWIIIIMETRSGSEKRWSRMESLNQNQGLSLLYWMNLW